jgi:hypothetical protein
MVLAVHRPDLLVTLARWPATATESGKYRRSRMQVKRAVRLVAVQASVTPTMVMVVTRV